MNLNIGLKRINRFAKGLFDEGGKIIDIFKRPKLKVLTSDVLFLFSLIHILLELLEKRL